MNIVKSNGTIQVFNQAKIKKSITAAMKAGSGVYYPKIA